MIDTKLVILEGLPATGKTTTSQFLQIQLERNGHNAEWVHEVADPHPTIFIPDGLALDEQYKKIALENWADFTEKALRNPEEIHIVDSAVFQCHIFLFLLNNAPTTDLEHFIREIFSIVAPLKPCLFYLYSCPVECQAPEGKKIKIFSPPGAYGGARGKQQSPPSGKGSEKSSQ